MNNPQNSHQLFIDIDTVEGVEFFFVGFSDQQTVINIEERGMLTLLLDHRSGATSTDRAAA